MDYTDFLMLMDIFVFTNELMLLFWWLIGGAFILFDDEGGEWFNMCYKKCYENMHVSRGSMYAGGVFVKLFSNLFLTCID